MTNTQAVPTPKEIRNSWTCAPGFQPCPTCKGVGSLVVPAGPPLFAECDKMTVAKFCMTCRGGGRVSLCDRCYRQTTHCERRTFGDTIETLCSDCAKREDK